MSQPHVARKTPCAVDVEQGQQYYWCTCGLSDKQPFCTGAHKGSSFIPLAWTAEETRQVFFCGCKQTKNPPFCDGSHASL
ncbi:MAG: CDGSH iron-sulfur domain-containing protein [Chromatiales bacterium]|nr:CDGSH iron-sulfur domain-containing protein [Chromatiales bacterium]